MSSRQRTLAEHAALTRRFFFQSGAAGVTAWTASRLGAASPETDPLLAAAIADLEYLTPLSKARILGRGNPPPNELSPEELREAGLHPDTWSLEVTPDPESDPEVANPLSAELGTAIRWPDLMDLATSHAVRYLHVCTCTNVADPFHMCLWEGVPLREIIWLAQPRKNVRRVFYYGYHNVSSKRFQSSLTLGRILEDPPGEHPVILAYKMNGQWIPGETGGPVRMIVPGAYGNKWVKWVQHIRLTNQYKANDTYALWNNDVESPVKTQARFLNAPSEIPAGRPAALTGIAQVGMSGLGKVQYSIHNQDRPWPETDPHRTAAGWKDATILPPPDDWGGGLPEGELARAPSQFDPATGTPLTWPLRDTLVHWAALLPGQPAGNYDLCCRTIDANGIAQPMPRPFPRTGANQIQRVDLVVS